MIGYCIAGSPGRDFRITQHFDTPVSYTGSGIHGALDFAPRVANTKGVKIIAPHEGYIKLTTTPMLGNSVHVESLAYKKDGEKRKSLMAHCEKFLVKNGEYVAQGQEIAVMGGKPGMPGAGNSTGIHVHWEYYVFQKGKWVLTDVEPYLFTIGLPKK